MNRKVRVKVIQGEPLDGTGRVCIHLFVQDLKGKYVEPHVLHPKVVDGEVVKQEVVARPTRGRLACDPNKDPAPVVVNGVTTVTMRTDDPQAVTCPKCIKSVDYTKMVSDEIAA